MNNSSSNPDELKTHHYPDATNSKRPVTFSSVALPAEHGSWSLVLEPILLGLLVAPSWAGLSAAAGGFAFFLLNRPLKLYLNDRRRGRQFDRTTKARLWAFIYGASGTLFFTITWAVSGFGPFVPLLIALPLLLIFLVYDQRPGRHWQAELAAPVAFAAIASTIALAGGWEFWPALALWGFMIARAVPSILFIRARLRLDKGKPTEPWPVVAAHLLAVAGIGLLIYHGFLPGLGLLAMTILLARAIWGLSAYRWRTSVKGLGFLETGFGLLAIILVSLGYWIG
jgi:hypothetical protein